MQKLTELVVCLIVIFAEGKQERVMVDTFHNNYSKDVALIKCDDVSVNLSQEVYHNIAVCEFVEPKQRTFIEHVDYKTKSCDDGYLADVDYIIITGFINVSDIGHPPQEGEISGLYISRDGLTPIPGTTSDLRTDACVQLQQLPPNSCRCLGRDDKIIRLKCNITLKIFFSFRRLMIGYHTYHYIESNPTEQLPNVYADTICGDYSWFTCSKNQGSSLLGGGYVMSGIAIIFTALFFTVSPLFSYGQ